MPTAEFNLEDIRQMMREEVRAIVREESLSRDDVREIVQEELVKERVNTRHIVRGELTVQFKSFVENNLAPSFEDVDFQFDEIRERLDRIEVDVKGIRRTVRKHSADIAELQAARGL